MLRINLDIIPRYIMWYIYLQRNNADTRYTFLVCLIWKMHCISEDLEDGNDAFQVREKLSFDPEFFVAIDWFPSRLTHKYLKRPTNG